MANYILLERVTVGANGAASISFNNIPQTGYTDLKVVCSIRTSRSNSDPAADIKITFNGSSANAYSLVELRGTGSGAGSGANSGQPYLGFLIGHSSFGTSNTFSNVELYVPNYTSANYKSVSCDGVIENNATTGFQTLYAGLWSNTAAITSMTIADNNSSSFVQYSTFSLYALAAVGTTPVVDPKALGGDIIQTDGTYWYHAFLSSGTFTPKTPISCDVLVVAGGGGGGFDRAAGGGAGGLLTQTGRSMTANTAYTATIGAGGGGASTYVNGTNGSNTVFDTITANGGGGGSSGAGGAGSNGGSGGGGGGQVGGAGGTSTQSTSGGATGYGNAGGAGVLNNSAPYFNLGSGGGGGAGAVGSAGTNTNGGAGGAGYTSSLLSAMASATSTGVSSYYAGGGGGGATTVYGASGGSGGGGNAGASAGATGSNGVANTGGGAGGGAGSSGVGGTGGSGIIIVRYSVA